jgi:hypothetical protein
MISNILKDTAVDCVPILDTKVRQLSTVPQYLRYLTQDCGWEVRPGQYHGKPMPDLARLPSDLPTGGMKVFIDGMYIIDKFGEDHESRREFRIKLSGVNPRFHRWLDDYNKLRWTRVFCAVEEMKLAADVVRSDDSERGYVLKRMVKGSEVTSEQYRKQMPVAKKLDYACNLERVLFEFMGLCSGMRHMTVNV